MKTSPWKFSLLPVVFFSLFSLLWLSPLPLHMADSIVGQPGDNYYFIWLVGWFQKALFQLHQSPFFAPQLNYPEGWNLAYNEMTPVMALIGLPASLLGGEVLGYNFSMLASFILSGLGMYMWMYHLSKDITSSLIAGMIFTFVPYRIAHFLAGHLNLMGMQWFPFYFWGLFDLLPKARPSNLPEKSFTTWKSALMAGISLGFIGFTSQYYLYMTLLATGFVLGYYLLILDRKRLSDLTFWKPFALYLLVGSLLSYLAVSPYLKLADEGGLPDRNIESLRGYSANLNDFVTPSTTHFLWGKWIGEHFDRSRWVEGTLYLGFVAGCLALLAFIKRKQNPQFRVVFHLLTVIGVAFFILALGTDLHLFNQPLMIKVPGALRSHFQTEIISIPLPGYLFAKYLPFYAKMRAWKRFTTLCFLSISALAGFGSLWLLQRSRPLWRIPVGILLLALVMIDFYPGSRFTLSQVQPRPVDRWLAQQAGQGALVQFPFEFSASQEQTYYTLYHNKPFIGGYVSASAPLHYTRIKPVLDDFPSQEGIALLKELGVQYVLVDATQYNDFAQIQDEIEELGLRPLTVIAEQHVYELSR